MSASTENDTAEYIQRRVKQALANKTLRDLHKTLAEIEAEEKAERKALKRLALVTLALLILVPACFGLYRVLGNGHAGAVDRSRYEVISLAPSAPTPQPATPGRAE